MTLFTPGDAHTVSGMTQMLTGGPVTAVLFDLDDTLYSCEDLVLKARQVLCAAAAGRGVPAGPLATALAVAERRGGSRTQRTAAALTAVGRSDVDAGWLAGVFEAYVPATLPLLPGVAELLQALRVAGVALGIVTNGTPGRQRAKIAALGLAMDAVVCADEVVPKPDPAPFRVAAAALGVPADQVLMVGDRPDADVAGAHRAGMRAVRVRFGRHADLPPAPHCVADLPPAAAWSLVRRLACA